ncbi:uncharacterized protein [Saccopteryx leptura]|uniref:uncharacterized protein isoform X2 n=1 Tax=Saccopteryx leptura TaxID=249018 RepID=UPI00339D0F2D
MVVPENNRCPYQLSEDRDARGRTGDVVQCSPDGAGVPVSRMVIDKLWDQLHVHSLPPRSLLAVVEKLTLSEGGASYLFLTWKYILCHLRMIQEEDDMLTMCQVLSALVICAWKHLGTGNYEVKGTDRKVVSIMAYLTFRILFNCWTFNGKPQLLDKWHNSQRIHEPERAMWCAASTSVDAAALFGLLGERGNLKGPGLTTDLHLHHLNGEASGNSTGHRTTLGCLQTSPSQILCCFKSPLQTT